MGLGSVGDPGLGGRQRTGRLVAHKQHEHSVAGAHKLLHEYCRCSMAGQRELYCYLTLALETSHGVMLSM